MKRKTAKEILIDSFREIAQTRSIDKITVKDITDNCGYSSATFYRHFSDKYDLIAWEYSRKLAEIMSKVETGGHLWKETLIDGAKYFETEKVYLTNLFLHTTGHDSFLKYMTETNDSYLRNCVMQAMGTDELDEKMSMCIHLYCHGTVALTCDWLLGDYKVTVEELAEVYDQSLPLPLRRYLCEE